MGRCRPFVGAHGRAPLHAMGKCRDTSHHAPVAPGPPARYGALIQMIARWLLAPTTNASISISAPIAGDPRKRHGAPCLLLRMYGHAWFFAACRCEQGPGARRVRYLRTTSSMVSGRAMGLCSHTGAIHGNLLCQAHGAGGLLARLQRPALCVPRPAVTMAHQGVTKEEPAHLRRRLGHLGDVCGSGAVAGCAVTPGIISGSGGAMRLRGHADAMRGIASPCDAKRRRARNDTGGLSVRVTASDGFAPATKAGRAAPQ